MEKKEYPRPILRSHLLSHRGHDLFPTRLAERPRAIVGDGGRRRRLRLLPGRVDVAWTNIATLCRAKPRDKLRPGYLNVAVYGEPRFVLELGEPATAYGLFGIRKQASQLGLTVDDEARFQAELNERLCD